MIPRVEEVNDSTPMVQPGSTRGFRERPHLPHHSVIATVQPELGQVAWAEQSHRFAILGPRPLWLMSHCCVRWMITVSWLGHRCLSRPHATSPLPPWAISLQLQTLRCEGVATPTPLNFPALILLIPLLVLVSPHPLSLDLSLGTFSHTNHISFFPHHVALGHLREALDVLIQGDPRGHGSPSSPSSQ